MPARRGKRSPWIAAIAATVALAWASSAMAADTYANCGHFAGGTTGERHAVVADIDGVLTQYQLQDYGPTNKIFLDLGVDYPRVDAALLMNVYYRKGYDIVYMAGRPANMKINGMSACDASLKWLHDQGFPTEPGRTVMLLHDGPAKVLDAADRGQAMADWMGAHGTEMFTGMLADLGKQTTISYDWGYADSTVVANAFMNAGIAPGHIYTIGNKGVARLGFKGTHAIVGPQRNPGFTNHIVNFVIPDVPDVN